MAEKRGLPEPPDPLEYELQEARAMAMGQAGRKLEKVLAALAAFDAGADGAVAAGGDLADAPAARVRAGAKAGTAARDAEADREALLDAAADAVWELLIVRESLRFFNHAPTLEAYGVPGQVLARVGVVRKR